MSFELTNLPLGIRRPFFSSLNGKSWVQVGTIRREAHGLVLDFRGEFEACRPIWEAVINQSTIPPQTEDNIVAFGVLSGNYIRLVAQGVVTRHVAFAATTTVRRERAKRRDWYGGRP